MDQNNPFMRVLLGGGTAVVMSALMITLFSVVPQHEAKLRSVAPASFKITEGIWEDKDFYGLIDTQWSVEGGAAEGQALQYHPNGSLFREMTYRRGRLEGEVREYYEKEHYRQPPVRGRLATLSERARSAGAIKKISHYRFGAREGAYEIYYPDGVLKESGEYRDGTLAGPVLKYEKDGRPAQPFWKERP